MFHCLLTPPFHHFGSELIKREQITLLDITKHSFCMAQILLKNIIILTTSFLALKWSGQVQFVTLIDPTYEDILCG